MKLRIIAAPDGRTRIEIANPKRLTERVMYVDLDADQVEVVAMNLLSRVVLTDG